MHIGMHPHVLFCPSQGAVPPMLCRGLHVDHTGLVPRPTCLTHAYFVVCAFQSARAEKSFSKVGKSVTAGNPSMAAE